ncbi:MAG: hypothetical protein SFU86_10675 [Pirellulaceae bacterium]|nr:hypothetical protein [Pirellulaceae bacterium]
MQARLPSEVVVHDLWPASIEYILPPRDLGRGRVVGWLLLLLGLVVASLLTYSILAAWTDVRWVLGKSFRSFVFLVSLPTVAGLVPMWWGLAALAGHRRIRIRGIWLRTDERLGPLWWGKRWRIDRIRGFSVLGLNGQPVNSSDPDSVIDAFQALALQLEGAHGMLAWGYRHALLGPLAAALEERCNAALEREGIKERIATPALPVANEEDWEDDEEGDEDLHDVLPPPTRPENSRIELEQVDGGLSIRVPPAGLWKGTSGLFFFSLLWNGFMTMFTTLAAFALFNNQRPGDDAWLIGGFVSLFWLIGIGLLLAALNMGSRKAGLAVADGTLLVLQTGFFGRQQREWPPGEVAAIRLGSSGIEVNGQPVLQLQIHGREGKPCGLLTGRDAAELAWIAAELRQALGVPEYPQT